MTMLPAVAADPTVLDVASDPGAMVVKMLEQSKLLLAEASRLEDVTEWRAQADAIATYTRQRDLGHEAELSAQEIVRRCERRLGELIREGQQAGEILRRGQRPVPGDPRISVNTLVSSDLLTGGGRGVGIYDITDDVPDEKFEEAISEARQEGNLSRANVARKARNLPSPEVNRAPAEQRAGQIAKLAAEGLTSRQIASRLGISDERVRSLARDAGVEIPADEVVGKTRRIDSNRVLDETVIAAEGAAFGLSLINFDDLDQSRIPGWVDSLTASIRSLNQIRKAMKELTHD